MGQNLSTARAIYEAFGQGNIPFILDQLSDDISWEEWQDNSAQHAGVPWLARRQGKNGALEFFQIAGGMGITDFQVLSLLEGENQVAAEISITTASFKDEEIQLWNFDADGKVNRLRHYVDTAKHIAAFGNQK